MAFSLEFKKTSLTLEQFFLTVGQTNFDNKIPFLLQRFDRSSHVNFEIEGNTFWHFLTLFWHWHWKMGEIYCVPTFLVAKLKKLLPQLILLASLSAEKRKLYFFSMYIGIFGDFLKLLSISGSIYFHFKIRSYRMQ